MHYPGVDSYVLLTRPLRTRRTVRVQLACVRHAASVNPEPESNSPFLRFNSHGDPQVLFFVGGRFDGWVIFRTYSCIQQLIIVVRLRQLAD